MGGGGGKSFFQVGHSSSFINHTFDACDAVVSAFFETANHTFDACAAVVSAFVDGAGRIFVHSAWLEPPHGGGGASHFFGVGHSSTQPRVDQPPRGVTRYRLVLTHRHVV